MADDFEAVPRERWWQVSQRATDAWWLAAGAIALVVLLVLKLIEKGYISGWSELLDLNKVRTTPGV